MKKLIEILQRPVIHTRWMHDATHALIAMGVGAILMLARDAGWLFGWPTWLLLLLATQGYSVPREIMDQGKAGRWKWDNLSDWLSYQPVWIFWLLLNGQFGWAGIAALGIVVPYSVALLLGDRESA